MYNVSIVIPNYNGMEYLKDCLDSLQEQDMENMEILLVDNGSEDGSISFIKEEYPNVKLLELKKNYGFCRAVNVGIHASESPYVILLNNDTRVEKGFVKSLWQGIQSKPKCFSCGSKMIKMHHPTKIDDAGDYYCALGWAFAYGKDRPVENYEKERRIFAACAGAAIYRKEVFQEIGYFDEKHFAYLEDIDIGYRAKIFGYENWYLPEAVVYHVGSGTSGSRYNEFKIHHSSRNNVYMLYKNMPWLQVLLNIPFLAAGFLVKLLFFARRGFGKEYLMGLGAGVSMWRRSRKVIFHRKNLKHYIKIQWELWVNILKKMAVK